MRRTEQREESGNMFILLTFTIDTTVVNASATVNDFFMTKN